MKKALATLAIIALAGTAAQAQLLSWDFTGQPGSQATQAGVEDSGLDSSNLLTRGAGAPGSAANNTFRTTGFKNDGISVANTDYFQFELSPTAGNTMNLLSIDNNFAGTGTFYPVTMAYAYSLDGTTFTLLPTFGRTGNGAGPSVDLSGISQLQNVADTTTVTFRFYASGATSTGGFGYISTAAGVNGLAVNGQIMGAAVPEPTTLALIGLGLTGAVALARRRKA